MTTTRRRLVLALLPAALLVLAPIARGSEEASSPSRISYVTSASVYVGIGSEGGLSIGERLDVVRGGEVIAELQVVEVSPSRARCARVSAAPDLAAGDEIRPAAAPAEAAPAAPQPAPARAKRPSRIRGRIGVRMLDMRRLDGKGGYRQPALDLRLDGLQVGGSPIDLNVDVRARRTTRTFLGGESETESRNRIYRLSVAYHRAGEPLRVTLGRQFSPSLAVVSLFDGVSAEFRRERWAAGLFSGSQPDPVTSALSSDVREHGGYFEFGNRAGSSRRWTVTTGLVASYDHGEIDREFAFLQQRFDGSRLSIYATQEMDLNRGWKKDAERKSWTLTSAFTNLRYRVAEGYSLQGGFDDRRQVRLFRDPVTPETEFDDSYRRGAWAGFDGKAGAHVTWGIEGRRSDGGVGGKADAFTARVGTHGLGRRAFAVHERSTRYSNERLLGWLHSISASGDLTARSRLEIHAGIRSETVSFSPIPSGRYTWYGIDWDTIFRRRLVATLAIERNQGASEGTQQVYATLSYRF